MTMKQSELEANRCKGDQTQENACKQAVLGFGFTCDWLRKQHEFFFSQSESKVQKNQSERELLSKPLFKRKKTA